MTLGTNPLHLYHLKEEFSTDTVDFMQYDIVLSGLSHMKLTNNSFS